MDVVSKIDKTISKILEEYFKRFGYVVERVLSGLPKEAIYVIHDGKSRIYITFAYSKPKPTYFKDKGSCENNLRIIEVSEMEKIKNEQELENILRKELGGFLEVVLRRIKLKQAVRRFIEQKLAPDHDFDYISLNDDDETYEKDVYRARLGVCITPYIELLLTYEWDSNKKTIKDMAVLSIYVSVINDKLRELIFNAILSYYLLS